MKKSINLSLGRKRVDSALKKVFYGTVAIFIMCVAVSLSLIFFQLILKTSLNSIDARLNNLNSQLDSLSEKKQKYQETQSRLVEINKIISKRSPTTNRINTIASTLSPNTEVTGLSGDIVKLQMTVESPSLSALNEMMEERIQSLVDEKKKEISRIEMREFSLNSKTRMYSMTFSIDFK